MRLRSKIKFWAGLLLFLVIFSLAISTANAEDIKIQGKVHQKNLNIEESKDIPVIIEFKEEIMVSKNQILAYSSKSQSLNVLKSQIDIKSNLPSLNAVSARVSKAQFEQLKDSPLIERVQEQTKFHTMLSASLPAVKGDDSQTFGYGGEGTKVCVLDTGFDFYHKNLPEPEASKDFTDHDWCIDGLQQASVAGSSFDYNFSLNVTNTSLGWIEIGVNWFNDTDTTNASIETLFENRYDLSIFNDSGILLANTTLDTPTQVDYSGLMGDFMLNWVITNISFANQTLPQVFTIMLNETSINDSDDYFTVLWGNDAKTHFADGYSLSDGCETILNDPDGIPNGTFANIHPGDDNGHGTHVTGIIASNNSTYKGVAPDSTILVAKVLGTAGGGFTSDLVSGIDWCIENGADILSMSLGGASPGLLNTSHPTYGCDTDEARAIDSATINNGTLSVVAAGNDGSGSFTIPSPGCARTALTVGSTTTIGGISTFSSRGPTNDLIQRTKPDIVAPGETIVSTWATDIFAGVPGTSQATPHVTGAAAALLSANSTLSGGLLKTMLIQAANQTKTGQVSGDVHDTDYGSGFLDIFETLTKTQTFTDSITNTTNKIHQVIVPDWATELKATLYWNENSSETHNDIDLKLLSPTINENFTSIYTQNITLNHTNIESTSVVVYNCTNISQIFNTTDYTLYTNGNLTVNPYPYFIDNETFVGRNDTNVTLSNSMINVSSAAVFNTTSYAEIWAAGNYTIFSEGNITLTGSSDMINGTTYSINYTHALMDNATMYCINYSYSPVADMSFNDTTKQVYTTDLVNGTWNITVIGEDVTGTKSYYLTTTSFDPVVYLTSADDRAINESAPEVDFSYKVVGTNLDTCTLYGNFSGTWSANETNSSLTSDTVDTFLVNLTEGDYIWNVLCNTTDGFSAFHIANRTLTIDATFPTITINTPLNNSNLSGVSDIVLNWTIVEDHIDEIWYSLNNTDNITLTGLSNTTNVTVSEGAGQNITIYANDTAGNFNSSIVFFLVDSTTPNLTINLPTQGETISASSTELNYTAVDNTGISTVWYSLDGAANLTKEYPSNLTVNDNATLTLDFVGLHTLNVYANDTVNNVNSTTITFYSNQSMNMSNWTQGVLTDIPFLSSIKVVNTSGDISSNENTEVNDTINITFVSSDFNLSIHGFSGLNASWSNQNFNISDNDTTIHDLIVTYGSNLSRMTFVENMTEFLEEGFYNATIVFPSNSSGEEIRYCETNTVSTISECTVLSTCATYSGTACYNDTSTNMTVYVPHMSAVLGLNDTIAPWITLNTPDNASYNNSADVFSMTVNVTVPEDTTLCNYTIDGGSTDYAMSNSSIYFVSDADLGVYQNGAHNITVSCTDGVNTNTSTNVFTIADTIDPTIQSITESRDADSADITPVTNEPVYGVVFYAKTTGGRDEVEGVNITHCEARKDNTTAWTDWTDGCSSSESCNFKIIANTSIEDDPTFELIGLSASTEYFYGVCVCDTADNCAIDSISNEFTTTSGSSNNDDSSSSDGTPSGAPPITAAKKASAFWDAIAANTKTEWPIPSSAISISKVTFELRELGTEITMEVSSMGSDKPKSVTNAPNKVYDYIQISTSALNIVRSVNFEFEVSKSWFTSNNYDPDKIKLYRYVSGEWEVLFTETVSKTGSNYKYKAFSPGFSFFAITSVEAPPAPVVISITNTTENTTCGNSICDTGETCSTCEVDCGVCQLTNDTDVNATVNKSITGSLFGFFKNLFQKENTDENGESKQQTDWAVIVVLGLIILVSIIGFIGFKTRLSFFKRKRTSSKSERQVPKLKTKLKKTKQEKPPKQGLRGKLFNFLKKKEKQPEEPKRKGPGVFKLD